MMLGGPLLAAKDHLGCLRRAQRAAHRGGLLRSTGRRRDHHAPGDLTTHPADATRVRSAGGTRAGAVRPEGRGWTRASTRSLRDGESEPLRWSERVQN